MSLDWPLESVSDDEIRRGLALHVLDSRRSESSLVAHVAEAEIRRLYAEEAAPSMFVYCTSVLHFSEAEAYLRITVARTARKHPVLLAMLADGRLHLSGIARLAPHLTPENRDSLLARAVHKTKRQVLELIAELAPRPDVPGVMRKLPDRPVPPGPGREEAVELGLARVGISPEPEPAVELGPDRVAGPVPLPVPPALVQPLSPARYKVQFTAGAELRDKLERLRALLRHEVPDGDLAAVIDKAVTEKLERLEARRFARVKAPREKAPRRDPASGSRYLSASVRRAAYLRDGGQCCFVDAHGRRCPERHRLEYHHRWPYGYGGGPGVDNICLMCRTHNRLMADLDYGKKVMARCARSERAPSGRSRPRAWAAG